MTKKREKLKRRTVCCDGNVFKQSRTPETAFVRKVQGAPDTMGVLPSDYQLRELERNVTKPEAFKIVSVDPTFNLRAFDVTVMTSEHGLAINKRTGKHPVVMGPIQVHRRKIFQTTFTLCPPWSS